MRLLFLLGLAACQTADVRAVVFYDLVEVPVSAPDEHYEHFVDFADGAASLGCFVVEERQTNCFDVSGNGRPNLHLGVVDCVCPCDQLEPDPCDATRGLVRQGVVRGIVNEVSGELVLGGVEVPVRVDARGARRLFISVEPAGDADPRPSGNLVLAGPLRENGAVLAGELRSPRVPATRARVTVVPVRDEVAL